MTGFIKEDEITMGFGASEGSPETAKHKHEFGPIPGAGSYFKGTDNRIEYLTIACPCGETKEIIIVDRREK